MIPYERHEAIMNLLREKKYVRTNSLAKHSMSVWRQSGGSYGDGKEWFSAACQRRGKSNRGAKGPTGGIHGRRKCAEEKAYCQTGFPVSEG